MRVALVGGHSLLPAARCRGEASVHLQGLHMCVALVGGHSLLLGNVRQVDLLDKLPKCHRAFWCRSSVVQWPEKLFGQFARRLLGSSPAKGIGQFAALLFMLRFT